MKVERSSAFLVFIVLITCGIVDTDVNTPAETPNTTIDRLNALKFYNLPGNCFYNNFKGLGSNL